MNSLKWQYHYKYLKTNTNDSRIENYLNKMGEQGWELVQILMGSGENENNAKVHAIVFKRPIN